MGQLAAGIPGGDLGAALADHSRKPYLLIPFLHSPANPQFQQGLISHVSATASAVDDHVSDYAQAGGALIGVMQSEHETERHAFMEAAMAQQAENGRVFVGLGMKLVARLAVFRRA